MAHTLLSKAYPREHLLATLPEIEQRCARIAAFTQMTAVPVHFRWRGETLLRLSQRLPSTCKHPRLPLNHAQACDLARQLDIAYAQGLIHGDLHRKNLFAHHDFPNQIIITDWEPALAQIRQGRPTLMCTFPYIHPSDQEKRQLSHQTDWLCFLRLLLAKANPASHLPLDVVKLSLYVNNCNLIQSSTPFSMLAAQVSHIA